MLDQDFYGLFTCAHEDFLLIRLLWVVIGDLQAVLESLPGLVAVAAFMRASTIITRTSPQVRLFPFHRLPWSGLPAALDPRGANWIWVRGLHPTQVATLHDARLLWWWRHFLP